MNRPLDRRRRVQNLLLRKLPPGEYRRLTGRSRLIELPAGGVVHDHAAVSPSVYFPMSGVCSIVLANQNGEQVEVGEVGCEGVTSVFRSYADNPDTRLIVGLCAATAVQVPAEDFEEAFDRGPVLRGLVREYYRMFNSELMQSVACNRLHSARQRYCRRLLSLADRLGSHTVHVTHSTIACMLGSTRPAITVIALDLRNEGAIAYGRNAVTILDRALVESAACPCYRTLRVRHAHLFPDPPEPQ